jgi:carboxypeptidase PM20D1
MHTTMAPTILRAGIKENIIPSAATAILNLRLLTGDFCKQVTAQIQETIDDPR